MEPYNPILIGPRAWPASTDDDEAAAPEDVSAQEDAASGLVPAEVQRFVIGVVLAALGLFIMRGKMFDFLRSLLPFDMHTAIMAYKMENYVSVVVGAMLAVPGLVVAGLSGRNLLPDRLDALPLPLPRLRRDPMAVGLLLGSAVWLGALYWHLATQQYTHVDDFLFFGGLALAALGVLRLSPRRRTAAPVFHPPDALAALGLAVLAGALNSVELFHWFFSWVGDEGAFYVNAHFIANVEGHQWNLFNLTDVYGVHPALDSVYQALNLKLFGDNALGWRVGEVLLVAASAALAYLLGTALFGRLAGLTAAVVVGSSHYLMAFARIGYNNTHPVFVATLAMLMLVLAWRSQRGVFTLLAGMALGFCLYTFQTALFTWAIVGLVLLGIFLRRPNRSQALAGLLMLLGFALVVIPGLLTTPPDVYLQSVRGNTTFYMLAGQDPVKLAQISLLHSGLAFWDNYASRNHYTGGPLADMVTAVLLGVGLASAFFRINRRAERLVVAWFAIGLALIALTRLAPEAHTTRLLYLVPAAGLLAGLGLSKLSAVLRAGLGGPAPAANILVVAILVAIPVLNLRQLLVDSPPALKSNPLTMLAKVLQEHPNRTVVQVGVQHDDNVDLLLRIFPWFAPRYRFSDLAGLGEPQPEGPAKKLPVYLVSMDYPDLVRGLEQQLPAGYTTVKETDPAGIIPQWVFLPEDIEE